MLLRVVRILAIGLSVIAVVTWGPNQAAHAISGLPAGFTSDLFIGGLTFPTAIAFAPNGKVFIAQKDGHVRVWNNGTLQGADFIDISSQVNNSGDRGLLGIAVHPNFPVTPYVYLLFTYDPPTLTADGSGARVNRLIRVSADAATNYNTALPNSTVIMLGTNSIAANIGAPTSNDGIPSCENINGYTGYVPDCLPNDSNTHSIGTVVFGQDGALYVGIGDGSSPNYVDARALRTLEVGSLSGKILRIDPITGQGLADNPFYNGDLNSNQSKVYNLGLRNPFRFTISPYDGMPYIGDVGWNTWEEMNTGRGMNFGWPCYEGGSTGSVQQSGYATSSGTFTRCSQLYNTGPAAVQAPSYAYIHTPGVSACIIGGAFYSGTAYPQQYQGALFYADYNNDWIKYLTFQTTTPPSLTTLASDTFTRTNSTDIGASWDAGYTGRVPFSLLNNAITLKGGDRSTESYNAVMLPADQWGEVKLSTFAGPYYAYAGVYLRMSGPPSKNGYLFKVTNQYGFSDPTSAIYKVVADTSTELVSERNTQWVSSDVLRAEVEGSTLRLYRNNSLLLSTTDGEISSGDRAGLAAYIDTTNATVILDNFATGSFGTGTTTVTSATSSDFAFDLSSGGPVQLIAGPDTNLYYLNLISGVNASEVRVIRYNSGTNSPPTAVITASPTNGPAPLTVNFSGAGSSDPNGDPITYSWNFGDGVTSGPSTTPTVSHSYSSSGSFTAVLTVTDSKSATGTASTIITSGNTAPVASITSPANNSLFTIGIAVSLVGQATDQQQGSLSGSSLAWSFNVHHNDHVHFNFYPALFGTNVSFTPIDHGLNTWIEVCLTATDSGGLSDSKCIALLPVTTTLTFQTSPVSGLSLTVDGVTKVSPFTVNAPINSSSQIIAPVSQSTSQGGFTFQSWSDGGAATHTITVGNSPATYTATYTPGNTTLTFQTNPVGLQLSVTNALGVTTTSATPFNLTVPSGSQLTISAPSPQPNNKVFDYTFQSWSDGGAQTHNIIVGSTTNFTATFRKTKR